MRFSVLCFCASILSGLALGLPTTRRSRTFNPTPADIKAVAHNNTPAPSSINAPRLVAPRVLDTTVSCNILVKDGSDSLGYISPIWNDYGEYGTLQPLAVNALLVQFTYDTTSPAHIELTATNGPNNTTPLVGAVLGFSTDNDDFSTQSYNYAYIAGTTHVSVGPAQDSENSYKAKTTFDGNTESAIWKYDTDTQKLSPQWINSDTSTPAIHLVYVADSNTLVITGGMGPFRETFGEYPEVTFTCVPSTA
ncbi:hypothetical protein BDV93DRAFT_557907 [Ceratobasidium sp. AG-I]|nr:hypothetical protein BDV93DRAFT_557907 [Ceratobasidium sp. AG-I]